MNRASNIISGIIQKEKYETERKFRNTHTIQRGLTYAKRWVHLHEIVCSILINYLKDVQF